MREVSHEPTRAQLLLVAVTAVTTGVLVWLPAAAQAGITATGVGRTGLAATRRGRTGLAATRRGDARWAGSRTVGPGHSDGGHLRIGGAAVVRS